MCVCMCVSLWGCQQLSQSVVCCTLWIPKKLTLLSVITTSKATRKENNILEKKKNTWYLHHELVQRVSWSHKSVTSEHHCCEHWQIVVSEALGLSKYWIYHWGDLQFTSKDTVCIESLLDLLLWREFQPHALVYAGRFSSVFTRVFCVFMVER